MTIASNLGFPRIVRAHIFSRSSTGKLKGMKGILVLALLSILVALGSPAKAATISFADAYPPLAVPFPASPLATLSQFDPALGTLTKVTLTLDADTSGGTIAWDNESGLTTDVTLGIGATVTAVGLVGVTAVAIPLQIDSALGVDADNDGAADFVGTDSFSVTSGSGSDSDMDMLVAGLGPYIGPSTFEVMVSAVLESFLQTTGGFGPLQTTPGVTDGTLTVTYQFTPIPEPSTFTLAALALLALLAHGHRRRRA